MKKSVNVEAQKSTIDRVRIASVTLMFERGYHGTSMRDVASEVGIQMSSLYHYFPSKQSLLFDIMNRTMDELIQLGKVSMTVETDPKKKIISGIKTHIAYHAERRMENYITDTELRSLESKERAQIVRKRDEYSSFFRDAIEDGQSRGIFRSSDVSVTLVALFGMINAIPSWYKPSGRMKLDEIATEIANIFIDGIEC